MLRWLAPAAVLLSLALSACGDTRTRPPSVSAPARVQGVATSAFASAGVSFQAPRDWATLTGQPPLVATVASGQALVAVWRYPRSQPLPAGVDALSRARDRLVAAVRGRDAGLQLIRSRVLRADGAPAIELDAIEAIAGQTRRVRSLHVFAFGAEFVLDEYAPPNVFHAVDHDVFSPLKRSLHLFPATG